MFLRHFESRTSYGLLDLRETFHIHGVETVKLYTITWQSYSYNKYIYITYSYSKYLVASFNDQRYPGVTILKAPGVTHLFIN